MFHVEGAQQAGRPEADVLGLAITRAGAAELELWIDGMASAFAPPDTQGVPSHYHETNSLGYAMAPAVACGVARLLGDDLLKYKACADYAKPDQQE